MSTTIDASNRSAWKKGIPDIDCLTLLAGRDAAGLTPPDFHWRSLLILVVSVICGWENPFSRIRRREAALLAAGMVGIGIALILKGHGC
jgi:hypothetical protein